MVRRLILFLMNNKINLFSILIFFVDYSPLDILFYFLFAFDSKLCSEDDEDGLKMIKSEITAYTHHDDFSEKFGTCVCM